MNLLALFIVCTIVIVILSTIKSIVTVKGSKITASIVCAITQAFNIYIVFLTADETLGIVAKIVVTFICNVIGVYIVKLLEEKMQKDKLWKIEFTLPNDKYKLADYYLTDLDISHSYISVGKYVLFNCYCADKKESQLVKDVVSIYGAKWFVSESKSLF